VESRLTEDQLLANYGYDPEELLREVYGPILDSSQHSGT